MKTQIKKILTLALAAVMAAAFMTGCGNSTPPDSSQPSKADSKNTEKVDISKVESDTLTAEDADYHVAIDDVEVTIGDAKVIDYNGEDLVIVEFVYKNNSSEPKAFTGALSATASQDDHTLTAWVVDGVDGVDMLSLTEQISGGEQLNVQKAFRLRDKENQVEVEVHGLDSNANNTIEGVAKTFQFN